MGGPSFVPVKGDPDSLLVRGVVLRRLVLRRLGCLVHGLLRSLDGLNRLGDERVAFEVAMNLRHPGDSTQGQGAGWYVAEQTTEAWSLVLWFVKPK